MKNSIRLTFVFSVSLICIGQSNAAHLMGGQVLTNAGHALQIMVSEHRDKIATGLAVSGAGLLARWGWKRHRLAAGKLKAARELKYEKDRAHYFSEFDAARKLDKEIYGPAEEAAAEKQRGKQKMLDLVEDGRKLIDAQDENAGRRKLLKKVVDLLTEMDKSCDPITSAELHSVQNQIKKSFAENGIELAIDIRNGDIKSALKAFLDQAIAEWEMYQLALGTVYGRVREIVLECQLGCLTLDQETQESLDEVGTAADKKSERVGSRISIWSMQCKPSSNDKVDRQKNWLL